jgi:hypothetical protein
VTVVRREPPLYILYPVTPTLSVDALQERLICELDTAVAVRPVGVDGTWVSVGGGATERVVNVWFTEVERLPAASLLFTL